MNPVWNILEPLTVEDKSTKSYEWVEIRPSTSEDASASNHKIILQDLESWHRFSQAKLECHFSVQKTINGGANANLTTANGVSLANGWGLFNDIKLLMSGSQIADAANPGDLHMLTHLPNYSKDYAESVGSNQMFYPLNKRVNGAAPFIYNGGANLGNIATHPLYDAADDASLLWVNYNSMSEPMQYEVLVNTTSTSVTATGRVRRNEHYDEAHVKSLDRLNSSATVRMFLPLSEIFPVLSQCFDRAIRGARFELQVGKKINSRLPTAFYANNSEAGTFAFSNLNISRISVWLPRLQPSLATEARVQQMLAANSNIACLYEHPQLYQDDIASLALNGRVRLATESSKVLRMYVAFQYASRKTETDEYPFEYESLGVDRLQARVNGVQVPSEEYVTSEHMPRILHDVHAIAGKQSDYENGSMIDFDSFNAGPNRIYTIDLTHQSDSIYKNKNVSDIELRYTMSSAPSAAYTVYTVIVTERNLSIDVLNNKMKIVTK
jgi:hypothetical protein